MINANIAKVKRKEVMLNKINKINVKLTNRNETMDNPNIYNDNEVETIDESSKGKINGYVSGHVVSVIRNMSDEEKKAYEKYKEISSKYPSDSVEYRNARLNWKVQKAGYGTREGVVAAAIYFIDHESKNVPYLWGGKKNDVGVDGKWGKERRVVQNYLNSKDQPTGSKPLDGLDCSGFVTWTIINGGFKSEGVNGNVISYSETYASDLKGAKNYSINKETFEKKDSNGDYLIKAGDLLYRYNHIAMIVDINRTTNTLIIAEQRGYALKDEKGNYIYDPDSTGANGEKSRVLKGMEITPIKINDFINGKYAKDDDHPKFEKIISMEDYYLNMDNVRK